MCKHDIEFADALTNLSILHGKAQIVIDCMIDHPHVEMLMFIAKDYLHEMGLAIEDARA